MQQLKTDSGGVKDKDRDGRHKWKMESHRASKDKREATVALLLDVKMSFTVLKQGQKSQFSQTAAETEDSTASFPIHIQT